MTSFRGFLGLGLLTILVTGCSQDIPPSIKAPLIQHLPLESERMTYEKQSDCFVCEFSGTYLEVWLEAAGKHDTRRQHLNVAYSRPFSESFDKLNLGIQGEIIVQGDVFDIPSLKISGNNRSQSKERRLWVNDLPMDPPTAPKHVAFESRIEWICPKMLPEEGKAFAIASFIATFSDPDSGEEKESVVQLKGRRLTSTAPTPIESEKVSVAALRKAGLQVYMEGYEGNFYDGKSNQPVKRVTCRNEVLEEPPLVTDDILTNLKKLTKLEVLELSYQKKITDQGLSHLKQLGELNRLVLDNTSITDIGLEHLKALHSMKSLSLSGTRITSAGLEHIKGLTALEYLNLGGTQITDPGMHFLQQMLNLNDLSLLNTSVTDNGLESLTGLIRLRSLWLCDTQITDAGLKSIQGCKELEFLHLSDTNVTQGGYEKLQKKLPNCQILWFKQTNTVEDVP